MTTTTTTEMTPAQAEAELQRLDRAIAQAEAELAQVLVKKIQHLHSELTQAETELAKIQTRLSAKNVHLFTLTFPGPRVALLEVRGAANEDRARALAWSAFKDCFYQVADGDQTGGHSQYFYTFHAWASAASQEARV